MALSTSSERGLPVLPLLTRTLNLLGHHYISVQLFPAGPVPSSSTSEEESLESESEWESESEEEVDVEITNNDEDGNQLEVGESEVESSESEWEYWEEEDLELWGPRPASEKSIMKLNEASFATEEAYGLGSCVVCLEDLSSAEGSNIDRKLTKLPCTHVFHNSCIVSWLERNGTCPLCRRELVDD